MKEQAANTLLHIFIVFEAIEITKERIIQPKEVVEKGCPDLEDAAEELHVPRKDLYPFLKSSHTTVISV